MDTLHDCGYQLVADPSRKSAARNRKYRRLSKSQKSHQMKKARGGCRGLFPVHEMLRL
jgi:hypothetical protein